ncbi:MAG: response regulator transcription factor [Bacteroidota bacterium]
MSQPIQIVLLDDHPIVSDGVKAMSLEVADVRFLGHAASQAEFFQRFSDLAEIDVLLLDIKLGSEEQAGLQIAEEILVKSPAQNILIFTSQEDETIFRSAMQIGVKGFLSKYAEKAEFLQAIRRVHQGKAYFGPHIAQTFIQQYAEKFGRPESAWEKRKLSDREIEILILFSEGLSYKEIAAQLSISPRTVEGHKKNILDKLQLQTTIDMVKYAIREGLIQL